MLSETDNSILYDRSSSFQDSRISNIYTYAFHYKETSFGLDGSMHRSNNRDVVSIATEIFPKTKGLGHSVKRVEASGRISLPSRPISRLYLA